MWPLRQKNADLVTFTDETLNGKFHFLRSLYGFVLWKGSSKSVREKIHKLTKNNKTWKYMSVNETIKNFSWLNLKNDTMKYK